jgi:uncharacterized repeat protein (TIGR01451 family)
MRHALRISLVPLLLVLAAFAQDDGPILKNPVQPDKPAKAEPAHGPLLRVEYTAPPTINLRKPLSVEITVKNVGTDPAERVRVEQELPNGVKLLSSEPEAEKLERRVAWALGKLPAGEERRLKLHLEGTDEGEFVCQPVVSHAPSAATTKLTRPRLALKQKEPRGAVLGDEVSIVIEVSNPGTGPASGVIVQQRLPVGLEHPHGDYLEKDVGTLEPGEAKEITLAVKARSRGQHLSQVTALADDGLEAKLDALMQVGQPELKLSHASQGQRYINSEAVFTLEVKNPGDAPARNVQIQNALPAELRYDSASDDGTFEKDTRTVSWSIPSLMGGASKRLTLKATPTRPGLLKCLAAAKAEPKLEAHAEAGLEVLGVPALLLEVFDADDPLAVGEETVYEIRVKNQGSASNTNVQIIALLPEGLALLKAEAETPHRVQGKQVIFEPLAELKAEVEIIYRLKVRGTIPGDYRTRVQLHSDQLRLPVCEEESTKVYRD